VSEASICSDKACRLNQQPMQKRGIGLSSEAAASKLAVLGNS
jgi:hypothetical protein